MPLRIILFADSFERVETLDDRAVNSIRRIAEALRSFGVDLMTIYAARAYIICRASSSDPHVPRARACVPSRKARPTAT